MMYLRHWPDLPWPTPAEAGLISLALGCHGCRPHLPDTFLLQVRGFWLGPWLATEAEDPKKALSDLMGYLVDKTIVPHSGVRLIGTLS